MLGLLVIKRTVRNYSILSMVIQLHRFNDGSYILSLNKRNMSHESTVKLSTSMLLVRRTFRREPPY